MTPALLHSLRQILGPMTSERKCEEVARVVLEHYREPSVGMVVAAKESLLAGRGAYRELHAAMIDAALSELSQTAES